MVPFSVWWSTASRDSNWRMWVLCREFRTGWGPFLYGLFALAKQASSTPRGLYAAGSEPAETFWLAHRHASDASVPSQAS